MSTVTSGLDTISQDWVQKFHFENKIDLSLQTIEKGESGKIEIDEIPTQMTKPSSGTNTKSNADSYLQSIMSSSNLATNNTSGATTTPNTSTSTTATITTTTNTITTNNPTSSITATCTNSPTCTCYRCQRQRRRAGIAKVVGSSNTSPTSTIASRTTSNDSNYNSNNNNNNGNNNSNSSNNISNTNSISKSPSIYSTTTTKVNTITTSSSPSSSSPSPHSSVTNIHSISNPVSPPTTPIPSPQQKPKRANTLRKNPTLRSYDRHMPKRTYSQHDSIYRVEDTKQNSKNESPSSTIVPDGNIKPSSISEQMNQEGYKISWKEDETGDDILPSLVTFHTIFEERGDDSPEGLSDLLEQRARQLRDQKLREKEESFNNDHADVEVLPPRLKECLSLSYRTGPKHNALTLYHTMKMHTQKERLHAYGLAFKHCVNADSGLRDFIKKDRKAPVRESSKLIQPAKRPNMSIKRTLLHPLGGSRKNKFAENDFIWSASSDNLVPLQKRSIEVSAPILTNSPTDVMAATQVLVPNAYNNDSYLNNNNNNNSKPYEYIDTPSRPRATDVPNFKDTSSISSNESYNNKSKRPNRLFSSLARKTSVKSHHSNNKTTSIRSIEKPVWNPEYDRVLDELCRILPHIDRPLLSPYVIEANGDYKSALQLCRSAVMSGKLT